MNCFRYGLAVLLLCACVLTGCATSAPPDEDSSTLGRVGVAYVGDGPADRAKVTYLLPDSETDRPAVLLMPGLGLDASLWLSTPDGRPGWAQHFAEAGYPAYALDPPETVASGLDVVPINAVRSGAAPPDSLPSFFAWDRRQVWTRWGLGPEDGVPFVDSRFPAASFDQVLGMMTPVVREAGGRQRDSGQRGGRGRSGSQRRGAAVALPPVYEALLDTTGPAVLVAHSAAGQTAFALAAAYPERVRALVVVEPVGCPTRADEVRALDGLPFYYVFGDHFEARGMRGRYEACRTTAEMIRAGGGTAGGVWLPQKDVKGNSHLLMIDRNSEAIADRVERWLRGAVR